MKPSNAVPALLAAILSACSPRVGSPPKHADEIPKDVSTFIDRRDTCDYFRGEIPDPGQSDRAREVEEGLKEYCTGTDESLAHLRSKYATDPQISAKLAEYEELIEAPSQR
ncbi:hypothetical protein JI752_015215 [Lysobacter sp. MMG2]|uniref:hypothetical protein n=1 Tax=Lysobacter sp. MMG2 TaxID=2801338 RepID=UPI001C240E00|nr:hypothetical protein [Lysobacter sp. MMG2]MBU8977499.1 hypothetical protein [Lysobacter sp. MMG2]